MAYYIISWKTGLDPIGGNSIPSTSVISAPSVASLVNNFYGPFNFDVLLSVRKINIIDTNVGNNLYQTTIRNDATPSTYSTNNIRAASLDAARTAAVQNAPFESNWITVSISEVGIIDTYPN